MRNKSPIGILPIKQKAQEYIPAFFRLNLYYMYVELSILLFLSICQ